MRILAVIGAVYNGVERVRSLGRSPAASAGVEHEAAAREAASHERLESKETTHGPADAAWTRPDQEVGSEQPDLTSVPAVVSACDGRVHRWYCSEPRLALNRAVVLRYRLQLEEKKLAASTINVRLAAVRRLAYEAADTGLLSPELVAGIRWVKGVPQLGRRVGNWLSAAQGGALISGTPETLRQKRDGAIISLLLGCWLRRSEVVALGVGDIQKREDH